MKSLLILIGLLMIAAAFGLGLADLVIGVVGGVVGLVVGIFGAIVGVLGGIIGIVIGLGITLFIILLPFIIIGALLKLVI